MNRYYNEKVLVYIRNRQNNYFLQSPKSQI